MGAGTVAAHASEITGALLAWYDRAHRALPWREDPSPYHVWLSEIMLQQTRVEAVKSYYLRFIREIPDIAHLASCEEERLLKLWEGLGYYSRVRNLQKTARLLTDAYAGRLPEEEAALKKLPGIGDYTAAAIASIAFGKRAAAVDGNVLRVMARLRADGRDIARADTKRAVKEEIVSTFLPKEDARCGSFNQALMELGATVCVPNGAPLCDGCPLHAHCLARKQNAQMRFPVKTAKRPRRAEKHTVLLLTDRTRVLFVKRPAEGLLAGLYGYPMLPGHLSADMLRRRLRKADIPALQIERLPDAKHIFTHIEWHMRGFLIRTESFDGHDPARLLGALAEDAQTAKGEAVVAADFADVEKRIPVPSAYRSYTAVIREKLLTKKSG